MADDEIDINLSEDRTLHALNNYGCQLSNAGCFDTAESSFRRALRMDPSQFGVWSNLGNLLWKIGHVEEAEKAIRKSISLYPAFGDNWINLALLMHDMCRWEESEEAYARAFELFEDNQQKREHIIWNRSIMRLGYGDWERGLVDYDIRKTREDENGNRMLTMPYPFWDGEDLNGKSIYIQSEQGIGDRILWSRYLYELREKYPGIKKIYFCVSEMMQNLLWEFSTFVTFLPRMSIWPENVDYAVMTASLIRYLSPDPDHLPPDPGLIRRRIDRQRTLSDFKVPTGEKPLVRIGIAWTGSKTMIRNAERSIPFPLMMSLAENPKVGLYSFQVGNEDIAQNSAGQLIYDFGEELEQIGFVAAGVAMSHMDLVITACTSTSHLAGALGVPCWTLLCYSPYWVWLPGRKSFSDKTAWYPNHRLFRQPTPGDWDSVIGTVKTELQGFCDRRLP